MSHDTGAGYGESSDPQGRAADSFTSSLWGSAADIFEQILDHPFLRGVADGTLEQERFAYFLAQDGHYVRSYAQCLSTLAGRAPNEDITNMLVGHAAGAIGLEAALHAELIAAMGMSHTALTDVGPSPTTEAYRNALLASCERDSFLEALVALLPCYWIYARVGSHLQQVKSPHAVYSRWIENYSGGDYEKAVTEVLDCVDTLGRSAGAATQSRALSLYRRGTQYEWMFWDASYRQETWPV